MTLTDIPLEDDRPVAGKEDGKPEQPLKWWQLSLLGVACTIGTGYFLGSGVGLRIGGPSFLFAFALAAAGTYAVYDALAKMTAAEPAKGSFRTYAKRAFGRWAGFSVGWVYGCSELLIMGSQLTALSLFTRLWLPGWPMWTFAAAYASLALLVMLTGTKGFERLEHLFAVVKLSAIALFLVLAGLALFGTFGGGARPPAFPATAAALFPAGALGTWSSLIFAFYAFGGIEIMGLMANRLRNPEEAPKAGRFMLGTLAVLYAGSIALVVTLVAPGMFPEKQSPFAVALGGFGLPYVPHAFNAILIVAGFSTMIASMFAVTGMIVTLAEDRDAPRPFARRMGRRRIPVLALALTTGGMAASVTAAFLIPESVYVVVTTAAGLMLLYNWLFILLSAGRLVRPSGPFRAIRYTGLAAIVLAVAGTTLHPTSRPGFFVSLAFAAAIGLVALIMRKRWKRSEAGSAGGVRAAFVPDWNPRLRVSFLAEQSSESFQPEVGAEDEKRQPGHDRDDR